MNILELKKSIFNTEIPWHCIWLCTLLLYFGTRAHLFSPDEGSWYIFLTLTNCCVSHASYGSIIQSVFLLYYCSCEILSYTAVSNDQEIFRLHFSIKTSLMFQSLIPNELVLRDAAVNIRKIFFAKINSNEMKKLNFLKKNLHILIFLNSFITFFSFMH